jgi:hypothetical protein
MWQLFSIWRFINIPLPASHPFFKAPFLTIEKPAPTSKRFFSRLMVTMIIGVGMSVTILTIGIGWVYWSVNTSEALLLIIASLPIILILVWIGAHLSVKMTRVLNKLRYGGVYDLLSITVYGEQYAIWAIGRVVYKNMGWLKRTRFVIRTSIYLIVAFLIILVVSAIAQSTNNPSTSPNQYGLTDPFPFLLNSIFLVGGIYFYLIQAIVMGYLIALWSNTFNSDGGNRIMIAISGFLGNQLAVYMLTYLLIIIGLPRLFARFGWETSITLNMVQLSAFIILIEIQVRMMSYFLARKAQTPYADWLSEVGI